VGTGGGGRGDARGQQWMFSKRENYFIIASNCNYFNWQFIFLGVCCGGVRWRGGVIYQCKAWLSGPSPRNRKVNNQPECLRG
jgi:hypothetical protein